MRTLLMVTLAAMALPAAAELTLYEIGRAHV